MTQQKKNPRMIYAKNGKLIDSKKQKIFKLYDGKVINNEDSKINVFEFEQIDFNLKDYGSNTITKPKIQEINTFDLTNCILNEDKEFTNSSFRCEKKSLNEMKQEILKRIYKPIYLPIIAIITCFLITISRNKIDYVKTRNFIFIFAILIIIFSETSLRYSGSSNISLYFYFIAPWLMIISIYSLLIKIVKNV